MHKLALAALAGAYLALCMVSAVGLPCKPVKETGRYTRAQLEQAYAAGHAAAYADGAGVDVEAGKP